MYCEDAWLYPAYFCIGPHSSKIAWHRLCEVQLQWSRVFPGEYVVTFVLFFAYDIYMHSKSAVSHVSMEINRPSRLPKASRWTWCSYAANAATSGWIVRPSFIDHHCDPVVHSAVRTATGGLRCKHCVSTTTQSLMAFIASYVCAYTGVIEAIFNEFVTSYFS